MPSFGVPFRPGKVNRIPYETDEQRAGPAPQLRWGHVRSWLPSSGRSPSPSPGSSSASPTSSRPRPRCSGACTRSRSCGGWPSRGTPIRAPRARPAPPGAHRRPVLRGRPGELALRHRPGRRRAGDGPGQHAGRVRGRGRVAVLRGAAHGAADPGPGPGPVRRRAHLRGHRWRRVRREPGRRGGAGSVHRGRVRRLPARPAHGQPRPATARRAAVRRHGLRGRGLAPLPDWSWARSRSCRPGRLTAGCSSWPSAPRWSATC